MDSMYYEKALRIKDGTPKDNQRKVFDYLNDGMKKVIEGSRKGSNVTVQRIIHGPGFKMNAKLETCFYGFTRDWGVQCSIRIVTRNTTGEGQIMDYSSPMFLTEHEGKEFCDFGNLVEERFMPCSYDKVFGLDSIRTHPWFLPKKKQGFVSRCFNHLKAWKTA